MRRALALAATTAALLTGCSLEAGATGPACTPVKTDGFPAEQAGITIIPGKTSCDGDDTLLPLTVENSTSRTLTIDFALRLHRGDGSELETVLVEHQLAGGENMKETADIYPWGKLDQADGPITARVGEFHVQEGPAPEPTDDVDVPDGDVDRPDKCNRKWYC